MSKKIRTQQGNAEPIWVIKDHKPEATCPECGGHHSLRYIGFVETYSTGTYGKMYQCSNCNTWIDTVWPKKLGRMEDLDLLLKDDDFAVAAV